MRGEATKGGMVDLTGSPSEVAHSAKTKEQKDSPQLARHQAHVSSGNCVARTYARKALTLASTVDPARTPALYSPFRAARRESREGR